MTHLLQVFIALPLCGFLLSLLPGARQERAVSLIALGTLALHGAGLLLFLLPWALLGAPDLVFQGPTFYQGDSYHFYLAFRLDAVTAVFMLVGAFLTGMVTQYSRYYLHRESGYKRFFNTLLCFYTGYALVVFSGNLETMFLGWEILGITSFLLIAFYRDRHLPVKNALKVFSVYRIGDVGLLLAIWTSHNLFHDNVTFGMLADPQWAAEHLHPERLLAVFVSLMILVAAAGKSAQLPFSSWLPRAMEGPTPSSAIFYGSLSVHMGVFLLLRTEPLWIDQPVVRWMIGGLGLTTSLVATLMARSQAAIKSQIAYSSITQIGLIFVEVALGLDWLALLHFVGNACLRTFQLLVSPSVVTYLIREQFYEFVPRPANIEDRLPRRLEYSLYMLSLKEFNLDAWLYRRLWNPLKRCGGLLERLTFWHVVKVGLPAYGLGLLLVWNKDFLPDALRQGLALLVALSAALIVIRAFAERCQTRMTWLLIVMTHFWVVLAVALNGPFSLTEAGVYLGGVALAGAIGLLCLKWLKGVTGDIDLDQCRGHVEAHPRVAALFLICALVMTAFPISPTFVGEDLIFSHIHADQLGLAFLVSLSYVLIGLSVIRIYAMVFLGRAGRGPGLRSG